MVVCTNFKYSIGERASTSLAAFSTRFGHCIFVLWWLYGGRRSGTLFNEPDTFDICCMHAAIIKLRKWRWCPHKPCCVFYSVRAPMCRQSPKRTLAGLNVGLVPTVSSNLVTKYSLWLSGTLSSFYGGSLNGLLRRKPHYQLLEIGWFYEGTFAPLVT